VIAMAGTAVNRGEGARPRAALRPGGGRFGTG